MFMCMRQKPLWAVHLLCRLHCQSAAQTHGSPLQRLGTQHSCKRVTYISLFAQQVEALMSSRTMVSTTSLRAHCR
jgi:hypothetical protein